MSFSPWSSLKYLKRGSSIVTKSSCSNVDLNDIHHFIIFLHSIDESSFTVRFFTKTIATVASFASLVVRYDINVPLFESISLAERFVCLYQPLYNMGIFDSSSEKYVDGSQGKSASSLSKIWVRSREERIFRTLNKIYICLINVI